jgi:hypothetical protein
LSMKKPVIALVMVSAITAISTAAGCGGGIVTGLGEIATWDMDYTDFNEIEISSAFEVEVSRDNDYLVRITIDKKLYEYLRIDQRGSTLRIGLKPNFVYQGTTQQAVINLPDLHRLALSSASKAVVTGFLVTHSLDFELSGASQMDLGPTIAGNSDFKLSGASRVTGDIQMDDGHLDLSGASTLELRGSGDDVAIKGSGASNLILPDFAVVTTEVDLNGASRAVISVSNRMDIKLSGGSSLEYIGNPKLGGLNVSGGSTINQR